VFIALKTLQCCGNSSLPEQRSALRAINTLNPPKEYIRYLRGLSPIHSTHWRGAQGLMWGTRGPFPPPAAMVVAVVTPVVFCAKATEKRNKNTKISWWLPKSLFTTIYCKTYCNSYITNSSVAQAQVVAWLEPKPLWSNEIRLFAKAFLAVTPHFLIYHHFFSLCLPPFLVPLFVFLRESFVCLKVSFSTKIQIKLIC
jgi:hypothetical protein